MQLTIKVMLVCLIPIITCASQDDSVTHNYLDIDAPQFFTYTPSPLQRPESLRQRPYYDFLSTLYRHDKAKSSLFAPQANTYNNVGRQFPQRAENSNQQRQLRKRSVIFRPLFEYNEEQMEDRKNENTRDANQEEQEQENNRKLYKREVVFRPLFQKQANYARNKREIDLDPIANSWINEQQFNRNPYKRAVVFRPLFVYRQQQVKKYKLQNNSTNVKKN